MLTTNTHFIFHSQFGDIKNHYYKFIKINNSQFLLISNIKTKKSLNIFICYKICNEKQKYGFLTVSRKKVIF